ncbi:hypothetical protein [Brevundimonas sp. Root608]|uniref:hypothetical protein n=1 Tax=Brevundimonas sp. Root608 TaxID=1736569 RepID=UPI0006FE8366|nr:hypothetical protein [Brevundimonas sp. Root608]KQY95030.1 hypothetical protein ASD25_17070 [Brevundimonas sp. Root1423]KRA28516.1 hypothetical protein ASD59_01410 [Brevundimonas sp. Root608]
MSARLHLICRDAKGLVCLDPKGAIYRSEAWALTSAEVAKLAGGRVYFHQTKAEPSYFGGHVLDAEPFQGGNSDPERFVLRLKAERDAKGVVWDEAGRSHAMAWSSGVLDD